MTQKWLQGVDPKVTQKWLESDFWATFESLLGHFGHFRVTFGSLWVDPRSHVWVTSGVPKLFGVQGALAGKPHHNPESPHRPFSLSAHFEDEAWCSRFVWKAWGTSDRREDPALSQGGRHHNHRRKIHPKKSTQNKKVHSNKFFWTISVGFLTRAQGRRQKFAWTFRKSSRERGVFLWYFGILGGSFGL